MQKIPSQATFADKTKQIQTKMDPNPIELSNVRGSDSYRCSLVAAFFAGTLINNVSNQFQTSSAAPTSQGDKAIKEMTPRLFWQGLNRLFCTKFY